MGFFIRKAFRLGPVRLNLSKSGVGVSAGVTGARLGVTPRGQPYVFGGRHGLYVRENLGSRRGGGGAPASGPAGPVTLYEHTGVTFGEAATPEPPSSAARPAPRSLRTGAFFGVAGAGLLLLLLGGIAGWLLGAGLLAVGVRGGIRSLRRERLHGELRRRLDAMLGRGAWDEGIEEAIQDLAIRRDGTLSPRVRWALESAFIEGCEAVASGRKIDAEELMLLDRLEALLGGASEFTRQARADAFRGLTALLVADHVLTREEEEILDGVREGLSLPVEAVAGELAFVEQMAQVRTIREGDLPEIEVPFRLRRGETAHFEAEGRLLRERQLRNFQRDRVRYSVRGLVVEREGQLLLTDRRLVLVGEGSYEVRHREILDVEVDLDENLLRITRDGRANPILITTPGALRAGAILAAVTRM